MPLIIIEESYLQRFSHTLVFAVSEAVFTIQTRKFEIGSIQFCIGDLVLFGFIFVQLSKPYGLYRITLSTCYHQKVITFLQYEFFSLY